MVADQKKEPPLGGLLTWAIWSNLDEKQTQNGLGLLVDSPLSFWTADGISQQARASRATSQLETAAADGEPSADDGRAPFRPRESR